VTSSAAPLRAASGVAAPRTLATAAVFAIALDFVKVPVFDRLKIT